jgi:hypothetical protein
MSYIPYHISHSDLLREFFLLHYQSEDPTNSEALTTARMDEILARPVGLSNLKRRLNEVIMKIKKSKLSYTTKTFNLNCWTIKFFLQSNSVS